MSDHVLATVVELDIPQPMVEDLRALVLTARGRYGSSVEEAAERLLAERLNQLAEEGCLLRRPSPIPPISSATLDWRDKHPELST